MDGLSPSTIGAVRGRLTIHARRWPAIRELTVRHRAGFVYVSATLDQRVELRLCRLRWLGEADDWGFALYKYSSESYDEEVSEIGDPTCTPEEALACAAGLYLGDPVG